MKKMTAILTALTLLFAVAAFATAETAATPAATAAPGQGGGNGRYMDANGDGVCDNSRYVDANGDGVCDNSRYVDANGDGVCDNCGKGNGAAGCQGRYSNSCVNAAQKSSASGGRHARENHGGRHGFRHD